MESMISAQHDVSESKQEGDLVQRREKAELQGQMAACVAHEILNPLSAISGAIQILRQQEANLSNLGIYDDIQVLIDRISGILRQMMEVARPDRNHWQACSLNALLEKTLHGLRHDRRSARVKIELKADPNIPTTLLAEDSLSQVFLNLAINALDAMESSPTRTLPKLTVSTNLIEEGRKPIIRIKFQDTGPGIASGVADRIFEPFVTTKGPGKGTGLGLPVSRRIVESHEGTLRAESHAGRGACFVIDLPVRDRCPR
jgi:two-component system NtrC family sensor kinase